MSTTPVSGTYVVDPTHTRFGFVARHAMVTKVRGSFDEFDGSGQFDADNPANSNLAVTVQTASVSTRNDDRDGHLRSNDFFDIETYPTISFASTAVSATGDGTYEVTGDLTIKDVTASITFELELSGPAQDPFGNTRIGLEGSTVVKRSDFGLTWNAALETGGVLVSDKVTLEFEVSAILQADG